MAVDHLCAGSFETLVLYRLHALFPISLPSLCLTKWTRLLGLEAIRLGSEKCEVESWLCGKYGRQCSKRVYLSRKFICGLNLLSSKHHYLKPGTSSAPGWQYAKTIGPLISDHAATLWDYQIWVNFNCCLSHILMVCLLLWYSCGNCAYWKHMASITQPLGTRPFPPPSPTSLHNPQASCSYLSTVVLPR